MVHHQHQHVLLFGQSQQRHPQQRSVLQIEGPLRLLLHEPHGLRFAHVSRHRAQVLHPEGEQRLRGDDLDGNLTPGAERRAQGFMPADQFLEAPLEHAHVQRALRTHHGWHVVEGASRLQSVQEPQSLLRERQRQGRISLHARSQGRNSQRGACVCLPLRPFDECRHRGRLEERTQWELDTKRAANPRDDLRGQQGVPAQLEEVVLRTDALDSEDLLEEPCEYLLRGSARRLVFSTCRADGSLRFGKGLSVHLAVRRQRQRVQHHVRGRHHVLRQPLLQMRAQTAGLQRCALLRRHVRHQALALGAVLSRDDDGLADAQVLRQRCLHLSQFDAEATHLHLRVSPAQELQRPVHAPSHHVARAVQPLSLPERVGHEALRCQLRPAHVPHRQAFSSHVQLARHSHRHRLHRSVQHVRRRVGDGTANGHRSSQLLWALHPVARGECRVLRRAVSVDEHVSGGQSLLHPAHGQHVTTGQQLLHSRQRLRLPRLHLLEERRRQPQGRDAGLAQRAAQFLQRGRARRVHHQLRSVQQRSPHLQRRRVEGNGCQLQPHLLRPEVREVRPQHQPRHSPVRHAHALRSARASRREHHVRQVVSTHAHRQVPFRLAQEDFPLRVHAEDQLTALSHLIRQLLLCHQQRDSRLALHPGQALQRVAGVQRHVHTTSLQDAQHAHHQLQRALHAQAHSHLGAHSHSPQVVRQPVGSLVQLHVREPLALVLHRHRVWRLPRLRLEQLREGLLPRVFRGLAAPLAHESLAFLLAHQRKVLQSLFRTCDRRLQQHPQVPQQSITRLRLEQVAVELEHAGEALLRLARLQREVELRRLAR